MIFNHLFAALAIVSLTATAASAQTLKAVKERGNLICGINPGLLGFSTPDDKGGWTGFDVDFCRAIAAAIFNDPKKVTFVPLTNQDRFSALQAGKIDVLSRNSTWTMSREMALGINFVAVNYYDGQGFMIRKSFGVDSALDLGGKKICTQSGTTTELNLADYFRNNRMKYETKVFPTTDESRKALEASQCDAMTSDVSQLYSERLKFANPADFTILPDVISKEPLGLAVRQGDDQWFNIVKWTVFGLINAEEYGVSSKTLDLALKSEIPDVKRLVGTDGNFGEQIGLTKDWLVRVVATVGNYGEIFERNIGTRSKLGIPRGINNLWDKGGIQYAPPIR